MQTSNTKNGIDTLSPVQLFMAGAFSGISNSVLSTPIEHVRTRLQVQTENLYKGPIDLVRKITSRHGVTAIYKGQGVTMVREFFGYGFYFSCYELLVAREMRLKNQKRSEVSPLKQILYGAMSGFALWFSIYPVDYVKSKLQTDAFGSDRKFSSAMDVVRKTYAAQGISGFFRGFVPCLLRCAPVNGATFAAYEISMKLLGR